MTEMLKGYKSHIVGGALIVLAILILLGLSVKALAPVLMILGGLGVIAMRLAIKKVKEE